MTDIAPTSDLLPQIATRIPRKLMERAAQRNGLQYVTDGALARIAIAIFAGYPMEAAVKRFGQSPTMALQSLIDEERDQADQAADQADATRVDA
jgi:hypothetical protein